MFTTPPLPYSPAQENVEKFLRNCISNTKGEKRILPKNSGIKPLHSWIKSGGGMARFPALAEPLPLAEELR